MSRAYTLEEVEKMRWVLWNSGSWEVHSNSEYQTAFEARKSAEVENMIRTYMAAGIGPDELEAKATFHPWVKRHSAAHGE